MTQKIGCLGAARIADTGLCAPAKVVGGTRLQAVAARDRSRAHAFAEKHGFKTVHDTYQDVIDDPDVTLVYNPLPISLHAEWSIKALAAGKHVLCEKPFAMNTGEAKRMVDAARASGRRLIEAFHYRYHPAFNTMLGWLNEARIGGVERVVARFTVPIPDQDGTEIRHLPETGGGAFMDLGTYPLHWARQVIGAEPTEIDATATLTSRGVDEAMTAQLGFASGAVAELQASMALDQSFDAVLEITGSDGRIVFQNPLAPHMGARLTLTDETGDVVEPINRISTYTHQLNAVVTALTNGTPLPTENDDSLGQQAVLDAVYKAAGLEQLRQM